MKAIAYFSNGLGNFVIMMPAFQAVAELTEEKKIDLCLDHAWRDSRRPAVEEIANRWPVIGKVLSWPKDNVDGEYRYWFYSSHGSKCEIVYKFLQGMKGKIVAKPNWRSSMVHESEHYMDIARAMGYSGPVPKVQFPLSDGPVLDLKRPIIGICNGWFRTEEMYWEKKGWPHFERLAPVLRRYFGASIVGIGGAGEIPSGVALDADFAGKLTITQTAKVLSQLDLFISTDTGPMHIANILDIPLISMFGPTLTSKSAPRGKKSTVLMSGLSCSPCQEMGSFFTCQKNLCMDSISVGDVVVTARARLNK